MKNKKILLLEDDLILAQSLQDLLESENFLVHLAKDGSEALKLSYENQYDLYLFDIDVPYINGYDLLKSLRQSSDITPCIFLSAKVDINSQSIGFEVGADDYVKKPFDIDELILRINTQIKKSFNIYNEIIIYHDLKYDINNQTLYKNNTQIDLSPIELKLFELFIKNINKTILKDDILYYIHNGDIGSEASLRVQISKLKKIGLNIINKRSIGYKLEK